MRPSTAMVLAAGLGTRFRAVSGDLPKPLVQVAGKALIDWTLDTLRDGGVERAVVNVHYKADLIEAHLVARTSPSVEISDERAELLETGGGLIHAGPLLGPDPVFCSNTDAILRPGSVDPVQRLVAAWADDQMDALLLLVPIENTSGYAGDGDFVIGDGGALAWRGEGARFVFTGLQIIHPRLWAGRDATKISTKTFWDAAMATGRLFGAVHDGAWLHVGDPEGFTAATAALGERAE